MTKPTQVLDEQGSLLMRMNSSAYLLNASTVIASVLGMLDLRDPHATAPEPIVKHWSDMVTTSLKTAPAYYVSDEMLTLARWAASSLPEDVSLPADLLPTASGFLMFQDAMATEDVWGRTSNVHAVMWRPMTSKYLGYPQSGTEVVLFSSLNDLRDDITRQVAEKDGSEMMANLRAQVGHLVVDHYANVGYSEPQPSMLATPDDYADRWKDSDHGTPGGSPIPATHNWVRVLIAIFTLMSQTVAVVTEEVPDRATAKRARRMNLPQRVTVITLRRMEGSRQHGESDVEWQHRWVVRGHWRNQRFGEHLAETRRIWIAPFVKGPTDAPLIITDKVYSLSR